MIGAPLADLGLAQMSIYRRATSKRGPHEQWVCPKVGQTGIKKGQKKQEIKGQGKKFLMFVNICKLFFSSMCGNGLVLEFFIGLPLHIFSLLLLN